MSNDKTHLTLKGLWEFATNHPEDRIKGISLESPAKGLAKFVVQENAITTTRYYVGNDWNYLSLRSRSNTTCGSCGHSNDVLLGSQLADHLLPFFQEDEAKKDAPVVIDGSLFVMKPDGPTEPLTYIAVKNSDRLSTTSLCPIKPSWCDTTLTMFNILRTLSGSTDIDMVHSAISKSLQSVPDHVEIDLEFFAFRDDEEWINTDSLRQRLPTLFNRNDWRRLGETEELDFGPNRTIKLFRFIVAETDLVREFGDPVERLLQSVRSE